MRPTKIERDVNKSNYSKSVLNFSDIIFLGISFTPKEIGEHLVSVKKRGRHVPNSPFRIMVGESEIADASKVKVYGDGCEKATAGETAEFQVDTRKAGK